MNIQILVSTMNQKDFTLIDKLNIQSDAIIINQTDCYEYKQIDYNGFLVEWYNVNEIGLSNSRNTALSKANGEICILVDDDEILMDNYPEIITNAFRFFSNASLIAFNLSSIDNISNRYINKRNKRLHKHNSMRYGSARIAFKRLQIVRHQIGFHTLFGAGSLFSSGEDSIFISQCLKKGLKMYSWTGFIAEIHDEPGTSTWFKGYNEKFFVDKGAVCSVISRHFSYIHCLYYSFRFYKMYRDDYTFFKVFSWMKKGVKKYKKL